MRPITGRYVGGLKMNYILNLNGLEFVLISWVYSDDYKQKIATYRSDDGEIIHKSFQA